MKRESDLLYEKWKTRKQEREKEGGRGTKKENNETVKKTIQREKKENGLNRKTRKSGSGNQRKTGQSVSERGGKRNVHQHDRRNKNNL